MRQSQLTREWRQGLPRSFRLKQLPRPLKLSTASFPCKVSATSQILLRAVCRSLACSLMASCQELSQIIWLPFATWCKVSVAWWWLPLISSWAWWLRLTSQPRRWLPRIVGNSSSIAQTPRSRGWWTVVNCTSWLKGPMICCTCLPACSSWSGLFATRMFLDSSVAELWHHRWILAALLVWSPSRKGWTMPEQTQAALTKSWAFWKHLLPPGHSGRRLQRSCLSCHRLLGALTKSWAFWKIRGIGCRLRRSCLSCHRLLAHAPTVVRPWHFWTRAKSHFSSKPLLKKAMGNMGVHLLEQFQWHSNRPTINHVCSLHCAGFLIKI